jgi:hypothetical protein
MLLGGGSSCQQCGCVGPCAPCTRTCQNPHSGAAFQVVGRGFSPEIGDEGAVSGRLTDGYLTASGNFEADMNGMSGGGPYYQQVGGTFYLDSTQTRFPCSLTVSFWRNTFTASDPPASSTLTDNRVRITCLAGQFAIMGGLLLLNPGESHEFVGGIPLSSSGDPRSSTGTYGGFATCDYTQVSIQARIEWNVQPRVHVLLGIVRECYEEGTPCATVCSGSPPPNTIYLTIKNVSLSDGVTIAGFAGTYVLDRTANLCETYGSVTASECTALSGSELDAVYATWATIQGGSPYGVSRTATKSGQSFCSRVNFAWYNSTPVPICGSGMIKSGSSGSVTVINLFFSATGTFDWEIIA